MNTIHIYTICHQQQSKLAKKYISPKGQKRCECSAAQSRQSAKLFLQSSELGLSQPLTRRRVCPPPPPFTGSGGMGIIAGEGGVGRVSILTRGQTLWYSLYNVLCASENRNSVTTSLTGTFLQIGGIMWIREWIAGLPRAGTIWLAMQWTKAFRLISSRALRAPANHTEIHEKSQVGKIRESVSASTIVAMALVY
jgi:hypothetical protein